MLIGGQRNCSQGLPTKLNAGKLDGDGENEDDDEEGVVEEVLENVDLRRLELPGVDLIEHLHQHEGVEEYAVMLAILTVPLRDSD